MAIWNNDYETDAVRLFVRERSMQRVADGNAERLATQIGADSDQSKQAIPGYQRRRWQHVHIRVPHFNP